MITKYHFSLNISLKFLDKKFIYFLIFLFFKKLGNESVQMTRMRAHWWIFRNPGDAVVLLGSRISQSKAIESVLLQGLAKHKDGNFEAGLSHLQRNTKLLYLHAYQSMVWNKAVSQRIKKFGFQVLVGDMVLMPEENKGEFSNCFCF